MKPSIHLFYGIIIGVLATLCMGSLKTDKAEFKHENIFYLGDDPLNTGKVMDEWKKGGWTIIEVDTVRLQKSDGVLFYAHVGK